MVILAGIAGLVAGAFSMAAGEFISMSVQRELFEAQIALERRELLDDPEGERHEVAVMFRAKGLDPDDAERIADQVMSEPEVALDLMAREELGLNPDDLGSPLGRGRQLLSGVRGRRGDSARPVRRPERQRGDSGISRADGTGTDGSGRVHGAADSAKDGVWRGPRPGYRSIGDRRDLRGRSDYWCGGELDGGW